MESQTGLILRTFETLNSNSFVICSNKGQQHWFWRYFWGLHLCVNSTLTSEDCVIRVQHRLVQELKMILYPINFRAEVLSLTLSKNVPEYILQVKQNSSAGRTWECWWWLMATLASASNLTVLLLQDEYAGPSEGKSGKRRKRQQVVKGERDEQASLTWDPEESKVTQVGSLGPRTSWRAGGRGCQGWGRQGDRSRAEASVGSRSQEERVTLHHPGGGTRKGLEMQELPQGEVGRQKAQSRAQPEEEVWQLSARTSHDTTGQCGSWPWLWEPSPECVSRSVILLPVKNASRSFLISRVI